MKTRCSNPNTGRIYQDYGGRGITVYEEWVNDFAVFREWALGSGYKEGMTIERKNVNGNYEPDNCEWIPGAKQSRNRRDTKMLTAFGETKGITDWSEDPRCAVKYSTLNL